VPSCLAFSLSLLCEPCLWLDCLVIFLFLQDLMKILMEKSQFLCLAHQMQVGVPRTMSAWMRAGQGVVLVWGARGFLEGKGGAAPGPGQRHPCD